MENRKYKVCRDDIYTGEVVRTDGIHRLNTNMFNLKAGQLDVGACRSYRSMLFVPNEENLADDLLYNSPNYMVLNVTDDEKCLNIGEGSIVVRNSFSLAPLLEYFDYGEELSYDDIIRIRKTFFTGRFGMDHSQLFGMKEFITSSFKAYKDGIEVLNEEERYELYKKSLNFGSERRFGSIENNVLPRELMDVLDERGRGNYYSSLKSAFVPPKEEGPIKKLSRF